MECQLPETAREVLAKNLRRLLFQKEVSQTAVAKKAKACGHTLSASTISSLVHARHGFTDATLDAVACGLGVTATDLMGGTSEGELDKLSRAVKEILARDIT